MSNPNPNNNPIIARMLGNQRSIYDSELHKSNGGGVFGVDGRNLQPTPQPDTPQADDLKATIAVLQNLIKAMLADVD